MLTGASCLFNRPGSTCRKPTERDQQKPRSPHLSAKIKIYRWSTRPGELVLSYSVCAPLLVAGPAVPWLVVAIEHIRQAH
ncbi:hypothetical protein Kpho02_69860 [Kitasatospora phosalacinea]|uniref:Uncharacterized protein n=1 Tax=Kitasatospora phosalacinea TaxID=2065 RepID=A0A9W6V3S0_9ACTN|nr:hypothetical protein Kpho02_69860 [Kitasatospora phosalacinea]